MNALVRIFIFLSFILCIFASKSHAQQLDSLVNDSLANKPKSAAVISVPDSIFKFNVKTPSPKRAALYSALLPSLGQIYNRQYWKTGVVAIAAASVSYFLIDNHTKYKNYQRAYVDRINNPNQLGEFPNLQLQDLRYLRDNYRKFKEYAVISGVVCYLLNILDAYTAAHLKSFDMSKDISFKLMQGNEKQTHASVSLNIHF
jgi:hypothetical protein